MKDINDVDLSSLDHLNVVFSFSTNFAARLLKNHPCPMRGFVVILDFHILHKISYQMVPKWFLLQFVQGKPHFGSRLP